MTPRIIAVDWSGAKRGAHRKIWLAEAVDGELIDLRRGRSRSELVEHLIEHREHTPSMVIGLDFAFSFPGWYMHELGCMTAPDLWARLAAGEAEAWLGKCEPPFWGRSGKRRPEPSGEKPFYRLTELQGREADQQPKSVFQINGGGAVGTGSLRGMCDLHELRKAGFAIWPFDDAREATIIEIYPRVFTRGVNKTSEARRREFLDGFGIRPEFLEAAAMSDDAFDAAISAIEMSRHARELSALPDTADPMVKLEGAIWRPPLP